jgi:hypothetical protein
MEKIQRANSGASGEIGPGGEMGESSGQWKKPWGMKKVRGEEKGTLDKWKRQRDGGKRSKS